METLELSPIRFVNIGRYSHVMVDGDTITNRDANNVPTRYFTGNGLFEKIWRVPQNLFSQLGRADFALIGSGTRIDFSINNPSKSPVDYYALPPIGTGQSWVVPVSREETSASRSDHFKIRIVNLTRALPGLPRAGFTGPMENLSGAVTLTYADGTPVNGATTNVGIAQQTSPYVEVPYGTYQFKVLSANGREISATAHGVNTPDARTLDPPTSKIIVPETNSPGGLTYAPMETFQPGGVYTIVVAPMEFRYLVPVGTSRGSVTWYQNQFMLVEDVPPPVNQSYARIQCVNGMSSRPASFRINGNRIGTSVISGQSTDYLTMTAGQSYTVEAIMGAGEVVAQVDVPLNAGQNVSCWLWEKADGTREIIPVFNDLSTNFYVPRFEDNGTYNRYEYTMFMGTRFLNLCSDIPYLAFTVNNGQDMRSYAVLVGVNAGHYTIHPDGTTSNLEPGRVPIDLPYARWRTDYSVLFEWMAYRSSPGIVPGEWADDIPTFDSYELVANPQLYTSVGRPVPTFEPGIYTLALIGRTDEAVAATDRARIIAVKHNK